MGKVKTICRVLMPVLVVVGMALSPFWAMETAKAASTADEDMLVGEGYWIYMQNDCTLVGFTVTSIEPSLD